MTSISLELRYWDGGEILWIRSHLTGEEFAELVDRVFEGAITIDPSTVKHCRARLIPVRKDGEFQGLYLDYPVNPGRGAFLMTCTEDFLCEEEVYEEWGVRCG